MRLRERALRKLLRTIDPPVKARHSEYSILLSTDDDKSKHSEYLMDVAIDAIQAARKVDLGEVAKRAKRPPIYHIDQWPGTHYRLLAGLMLTIKPKQVVEIGTGTGLSCLSMKKFLPKGSKITTFDVQGWKEYPETHLEEGDFTDGNLLQHTDDLRDPEIVDRHRGVFERSEIIFIDAAKDGVMEQILMDNLRKISFKQKVLLVFDDIRLWNMLKIWRDIQEPKMDMTSFGNWTGTGFVEWN